MAESIINYLLDVWDGLPSWLQGAVLLGAGAIGGGLATFFRDSFSQLLKHIGESLQSVAASSWRDRKFEKQYLDWLVAEHKDLRLVGVQAEDKPLLEEVFVSLRILPVAQALPASRERRQMSSLAQPESTQRERVLSIGELIKASQRVVILGEPGAGKTTLLQFIALTFARERAGEKRYRRRGITHEKLAGATWRLPVFVPLRLVVDDTKFADWSSLIGLTPHIQYPEGYFERQLQKGRCILLLDGMDELKSDQAHEIVAEAIGDLAAPPYSNNQFVVSCRVAGWRNRLSTDFAKVIVRDFDPSQTEAFIRSWYRAVEANRLGAGETEIERQIREERISKRADELISALARNERLRRLARNPLLLSIIAVVHRIRLVLPRQRARLYGQCTELLLEQWDIARGIQVDDTELKLSQKELLMRAVAYHLQETGQPFAARRALEEIIETHLPSMDKRRLSAANLLRLLEQRSGLIAEMSVDVLTFAHLTFQEYFAAQAVANDKLKLAILSRKERMFDPKWREVVLLYVGVIEDATEFISSIFDQDDEDIFANRLRLAAACLNDANKVAPSLRTLIVSGLLQTWYDTPYRLLRKEIGEVISALDSNEVSEEMSALFRSGALDVSRYVISAFAGREQSDTQAVRQGLLQRLRDPDAATRAAAVDELKKHDLTEPSLLKALTASLQDEDLAVRRKAMDAISAIRQVNESIIEAILEQCYSSDHSLRLGALTALGDAGLLSARALQVLVAALENPDPAIAGTAARALAKLGQGTADVVAALHRVLQKGPMAMRLQAGRTLLLVESHVEAPLRVVEQALSDKDWVLRAYAARVLGETAQAGSARNSLLRLAEADPHLHVRVAAIDALATLNSQDASVIDTILDLTGDAQPDIRDSATLAAIQLGNPSQAVLERVSAIMSSPDESMRSRLVSALGLLAGRDPRWISQLTNMLEDPSPTVRGAIAIALGEGNNGDSSVVTALLALLHDSERANAYGTTVQQLAYEALYRLHLSKGIWIGKSIPYSNPMP